MDNPIQDGKTSARVAEVRGSGRVPGRWRMKKWLGAMRENALLLWVWNRWFGGNRRHVAGPHNCIRIGKSRLSQSLIQIRGSHNSVAIGSGCRLHDLKILVTGDGHRIEIGDNCQLRGKIKVEDHGSCVRIGAGTTMENAYLGAYEGTSIEIGNDCMFSDQVGLRTGDMHSIVDAETGRRLNHSRSIVVEPHAWICRGATVMKGCTIGMGTVIGGFSVATSSLPSRVLAVGVPAAIVRENVQWVRERIPGDAKG